MRPLSGLMATLDEVTDSKQELTERHVDDVRQALGLLVGGLDPQFAEFRGGYTRAKADPRVRETEGRWRTLLSTQDGQGSLEA